MEGKIEMETLTRDELRQLIVEHKLKCPDSRLLFWVLDEITGCFAGPSTGFELASVDDLICSSGDFTAEAKRILARVVGPFRLNAVPDGEGETGSTFLVEKAKLERSKENT